LQTSDTYFNMNSNPNSNSMNEDTDKKDVEVEVTPEPVAFDRLQHAEYHAKLSWRRKILYHLWDNDQHLKSPEERKLIRKLDAGILLCKFELGLHLLARECGILTDS
jgi:hypothetical protein